MEVVVVEVALVLMRQDGTRFWMLPQLRHVLSSVSPFERGEITSTPVLALPEQVLAK